MWGGQRLDEHVGRLGVHYRAAGRERVACASGRGGGDDAIGAVDSELRSIDDDLGRRESSMRLRDS